MKLNIIGTNQCQYGKIGTQTLKASQTSIQTLVIDMITTITFLHLYVKTQKWQTKCT